MLQFANTSTSTGGSVTIGPGPLVVNGTNNYVGMFIPTAQDLNDSSGGLGAIAEQAARTSTTCYMKGFAENIRIQTSSGIPWFWRRIIFSSKRPTAFNTFSSSDTPTQTNSGNPGFVDTTNGMERLYFNQFTNNANNTIGLWYTFLFRGVQGKDWVDPLTAPVDPTRVNLRSDVSRTIRSGNASGTVRDFKTWVPMNRNLVYDDDESGDNETTAYLSVQDNRGLGDIYVFDIFIAGTGAGSGDLLQLTSTSSLYWHEK